MSAALGWFLLGMGTAWSIVILGAWVDRACERWERDRDGHTPAAYGPTGPRRLS